MDKHVTLCDETNSVLDSVKLNHYNQSVNTEMTKCIPRNDQIIKDGKEINVG